MFLWASFHIKLMRVAGYGGLDGKGPAANTRTQYLHTQKLVRENTESIFSMFLSKHVQIQHIPDIEGQFWRVDQHLIIIYHPNSALEYIYLTLPNQEKTTHSRHQAPALLLPVPVLVAAGISGVKSLLEGRIYLSWAAVYFKRRNGKDTVFPHSHGIHVWYIFKYVFIYIYICWCFRAHWVYNEYNA